ncbi:unnamed protein product [Arctia plantaginis]|uniref:EF-hand domain-containing protein n=1 Tax=Arctia plantaginis TaxID=874455 RepID=A0A8S1B379_ARCPL|nr:unnamed protein product [Arctia plantaginis]
MVQCHPPLELEELPKEDEERLETLFSKLDTDGNGKIDIHDLSVALKELAPHINRNAKRIFSGNSAIADTGANLLTYLKVQHELAKARNSWRSLVGRVVDVTLSEFIHYVREHEKNLKLQFSHIDKNKDGKVDLEELISAFADLGIAIGRTKPLIY